MIKPTTALQKKIDHRIKLLMEDGVDPINSVVAANLENGCNALFVAQMIFKPKIVQDNGESNHS